MTQDQQARDADSQLLLDDDVVYAKTHFGHREILFEEHDLTTLERRFLMVANGNTPLRALVDRLDLRGEVPTAIRRLLALGMSKIVRS